MFFYFDIPVRTFLYHVSLSVSPHALPRWCDHANACLAALLFAIVGATLSVLRHYNFMSWEDLAMFDQMLWNVREGRGLITTLSGNLHLMFEHHFFGEHLSPILYLLAYPAGLTRGPEFLLVIQSVLVGLSAWPLAIWARQRIGSRVAGWCAPASQRGPWQHRTR